MSQELINALKLALPYVEKAATTQPTQQSGVQRRQDAINALKVVKAALAAATMAAAA